MIKIKKLFDEATFDKAHPHDAGYDLTACEITKRKDGLFMLNLGVQIEPPEGHYFQLVPRSSFGKSGFILANSVGIIDTDYRGTWYFGIRPLKVIYNGKIQKHVYLDIVNEMFLHKRVAQAILCRNIMYQSIEYVDDLSKTARGTGGFGSTDK